MKSNNTSSSTPARKSLVLDSKTAKRLLFLLHDISNASNALAAAVATFPASEFPEPEEMAIDVTVTAFTSLVAKLANDAVGIVDHEFLTAFSTGGEA